MTRLRPGRRASSGAVTVALALDAEGRPKRLHYYLITAAGPSAPAEAILFDILDLADAVGLAPPVELSLSAFDDAWMTRLAAVACFVCRAGPQRIATRTQRALSL